MPLVKTIVFLVIFWANGDSEFYAMANRAECERLSERIGPLVESADCESFTVTSGIPNKIN